MSTVPLGELTHARARRRAESEAKRVRVVAKEEDEGVAAEG